MREVFYCGDAFATVVSVNRTGGTVDIPFTLEPETAAEKQRCAGSVSRRHERLEVCFISLAYNCCSSFAIIVVVVIVITIVMTKLVMLFCYYHHDYKTAG